VLSVAIGANPADAQTSLNDRIRSLLRLTEQHGMDGELPPQFLQSLEIATNRKVQVRHVSLGSKDGVDLVVISLVRAQNPPFAVISRKHKELMLNWQVSLSGTPQKLAVMNRDQQGRVTAKPGSLETYSKWLNQAVESAEDEFKRRFPARP
jgi:hypothetical protein